jgi:hypothetical protein
MYDVLIGKVINALLYLLQTPLHGFSICIDLLLEDAYSDLPESKTKDHFIQTLDMCKTDCSFMSIAINRTVDFTKSMFNEGELRLLNNLLFSFVSMCYLFIIVFSSKYLMIFIILLLSCHLILFGVCSNTLMLQSSSLARNQHRFKTAFSGQ